MADGELKECDSCGEVHAAEEPAQTLDSAPTLVAAQLPTEARTIWLKAYNSAAIMGSGRWDAEQAGWRAVEAEGYAPDSLPKYVKVKEDTKSVFKEANESKEGRVWDVVLIEAGDSANRRRYPAQVLSKAAHLFEGTKAYADHPTKEEMISRAGNRSVREIVGYYQNAKWDETLQAITAQLHVLESAQWLRDLLRETIQSGAPPLVGLSINAEGETTASRQGDGIFLEVTQISKVHSVDIVTAPAAGGSVMRLVAHVEQEDVMDDVTTAIKELPADELRKLRPELFKDSDAPANADPAAEPKDPPAVNPAYPPADPPKPEATTDPAAPGADPEKGDEPEKGTDPAGEPEKEPALALAEARKAAETANEMLQEIQQTNAKTLWKAKLTEASLPPAFADMAEDKFQTAMERRLVESADMDAIIKSVRDHWAKVDQHYGSGKVTNIPSSLRESSGDGVQSEHDRMVAAIDGMLSGQNEKLGDDVVPRFMSIREAFCRWTGQDPFAIDGEQVFRESLGGYDAGDLRTQKRLQEALSSTSWNEVFADRMHKRMLAEYQLQNLDDWRKIVSNVEGPSDFRTQRRIRVGGYGTLSTVAERDTYPELTSPTDEEATYSVAKRGGLEDVSIEAIANDDLAQIRRVPAKLARAAAQTLYRFVFDFLDDNPTLGYDSTALFDAAHNNLGSVALADAEFAVAWREMRSQTAYNNTTEILGVKPKYLIVPNELEITAWRLITSAVLVGATNNAGTEPNFFNRQGIELIVVDYWTDDNNWYLVADPRSIPTIEIGFLNGREDPELFVQDQPNVGSVMTADKITYKIRHIYGGDVLDHRGFRGAVVA